MKNKLFIFVIGLIVSIASYSQTQNKYFYDKNGFGCAEEDALFYRIVNFSSDSVPVGEIKEYYTTGELKARIEGAISINEKFDMFSFFTGLAIYYYKSGAKEVEILRDSTGSRMKESYWYENGQLKKNAYYKNGKYNGKYTTFYENGNTHVQAFLIEGNYEGEYLEYYESGKIHYEAKYKAGLFDEECFEYYENGNIKQKYIYDNGKVIGKFHLACDESGDCEQVFTELFQDTMNINEWPLIKNHEDIKSEIIPIDGLSMECSKGKSFFQIIDLPLNPKENFTIMTTVEFKSGKTEDCFFGLIWGYKNKFNYSYFAIAPNGTFWTGEYFSGIDLDEFGIAIPSNVINKGKAENNLTVNCWDGYVYFRINDELIDGSEFTGLSGDKVGFFISGEGSVLFWNLLVWQGQTNTSSEEINPSTESEWEGNGTGFFISTDGYLATNYHVVEDASEIEIEFIRDGERQTYKAVVIQTDKVNDLAIIKIDDKSFIPFSSIPYNFETSILDVGSSVFALGYPMALSAMGTEIKFTDGKVSSKSGFQGDVSTYQTTTPIQPGNSGGPLFDYDGNLVGINSAKIRSDIADNVSYSIKASYLKNLIDVLPFPISLPNDKSIYDKTLTEKIKILSNYVVLIKIK